MKYLLFILSLVTVCTARGQSSLDQEIQSIENGLILGLQEEGKALVKYSIAERMKHYKVPGVSIAVVQDGKIRWAKGYGIANTQTGSKVDTSTMFQAGSISKPLAALAVLKLLDEGKVDLDSDVNTYLKDWKVTENKFTQKEKVTLRRLMTHTAGTTVHGFPGYTQKDNFPSINTVLKGEGNTAQVVVDTKPGSKWRYSGGGYTIMEKVVEEVSGMPLEVYLEKNILKPMGLHKSTYAQPLPKTYHAQASAAYNSDGELIEGLWHNYPEQAAAGLWTTPRDLARYYIAIQEILSGQREGVLSKATVEKMLTKHKNEWGLGPSLRGEGDSLRFQHGGKNAGFTNTMTGFAHLGSAVIIMTNADQGGKLMHEILRSVSLHYQWGIAQLQYLKLMDISEEELDKLTGKYKLKEQVPGIGDYFVTLERQGKTLILTDPNNGEVDKLRAWEPATFIDMEDGDRMKVKIKGDKISFVWNREYTLIKVE